MLTRLRGSSLLSVTGSTFAFSAVASTPYSFRRPSFFATLARGGAPPSPPPQPPSPQGGRSPQPPQTPQAPSYPTSSKKTGSSGSASASSSAKAANSVVSLNDLNFQEVITSSTKKVLLVDCMSPGFENCKKMSALLDATIPKYSSIVNLARLDVSLYPHLGDNLGGIRSVPTTVVVRNNQILHSFQGVPSSEDLTDLLGEIAKLADAPENLTPQQMLDRAKTAAKEERFDDAKKLYNEALKIKEADDRKTAELHSSALAGLAQVFLGQGLLKEAEGMVEVLKKSYTKQTTNADVAAAINLVGLRSRAAGVSEKTPLESLREAVAKDPSNVTARTNLVLGLIGASQLREAGDEAILLAKVNKEEGKKMCLQVIGVLGKDHEVAKALSRRLSNILYV